MSLLRNYQMRKMWLTLLSLSIFGVFCKNANSEESMGESGDKYTVDQRSPQDLKVSWLNGRVVAKGVLGEKGEITRGLVNFDGRKALHYENLASRTQFEAFVTLKRVNDELFIDCIYGNIRSDQNGVIINKAVCGLERKLLADYEQIIYDYSGIWKSKITPTAMRTLIQTPSTPATIEEASIENIKIVRIYKSKEDLQFNVPTTKIIRGERSHGFDAHMVFTVYQKSNLEKPTHLEVVTENLEAPFEKMDHKRLFEFLN
ncbi:hypothetical protein K5D68_00200 [Pseudomonas cichorii]|nr:hypothetical protein [Pseudomonas cichorii]MBX8583253.1 hypothetical protein [Pseudomonas cichorii]